MDLDATHDLETLFRAGTLGASTDDQLLSRFLEGEDAAFEVLVDRHGPMVLRICRGVLHDPHDAQDAFQAAFLVLVRQARSIRNRDSVASFLFGVAGRVAARARADAARRRKHERGVAAMTTETVRDRASDRADLVPIVHEEVARLPAAYRAAVVLCDLEGRCYEDAARAVGCPLGTFKARLSRARARLRHRLTRRGLDALAVVPAARVAAPEAALLAKAMTRAASAYRAGRSAALAAGAVSARVGFLTEGMIWSMSITKLTLVAMTTLAVGLSAAGVALLAAPGADESRAASTPPRTEANAGPVPVVLTNADVDRQAVEAARSFPGMAERAELLLSLGKAQVRRKESETARRTLLLAAQAAASIPANSSNTYPHPIIRIAEAQAVAGDLDGARRTFRKAVAMLEAEDFHHQAQNWINIVPPQLRTLGRITPETAAGYRRFQESNPFNSPDQAVAARLMPQAAAGDTRGALREVAVFAGPQEVSLRKSALLGILGVVRPDDPAAAEVLEQARRAVSDDEERRVANRTSNGRYDVLAIAQAEARFGRFAEALVSARSLKTEGLPHPIASSDRFNQALRIIEIGAEQLKAGDRAGAVASAREALAIVDAFREESYQTYPRSQAGQVLIDAGELTAARQLAETISPYSRADLLARIADASRAAGDAPTALVVLKQALHAAEEQLTLARKRPPTPLKPDPRDDAINAAVVEVVRLQGKLGDLPAARRTAETIADPSKREEALRILAATRAGEGDLVAARQVIDQMRTRESQARAWVAVACALPASRVSTGGAKVPARTGNR